MFNLFKTAVLMAAITALFMFIGAAIGGRNGMMLALMVALGMNFFSYWFSDTMVLKMYRAREVDAASSPQFFRMVQELAASLIQMAISRAREFEADRGGAEISGDPAALASALNKIHRLAQGIPLEAAERHPETAQMMIMNPLSGGGIAGLFSTHPSTEERVARLMAMAQGRP